MIDKKRIKNKLRTAFIWITHYFSLIEEDDFHRATDMCSWELLPPSFYRTHTEEIKEATEAAVARIRVMLDELEMLEKREGKGGGADEDISG